MKPMKFLKYLFISVLVLLGVAILGISMTINTTVKNALEQTGSHLAGTSVTVDRVSISPFTGRGEVNGFKVANPEGFRDPYVFTSDQFIIQLSLRSLLSDEIFVNEIILTNPSVFIEQKLPENNLYSVLRNIQEEASDDDASKDMEVGYFRMSGATAALYSGIGGDRSVSIAVDTIELTDIGTQDGNMAAEKVVQQIAEQVVRMILQDAVQSGGSQVRDAIRDLFD
jgi:hypothetical protein